MSITWVTGPPGSGKTTYVAKHKGQGDLVYDMDAIACAMVSTQGRGAVRSGDVLLLMEAIRSEVIRRARQGLIARKIWMIVSSEATARSQSIADDVIIRVDQLHTANSVPVE